MHGRQHAFDDILFAELRRLTTRRLVASVTADRAEIARLAERRHNCLQVLAAGVRPVTVGAADQSAPARRKVRPSTACANF